MSKSRALALPIATLLAMAGLGATAMPASALPGPCPNEAIREEQPSTHLPDCRAYEMVTSPYKAGEPVFRLFGSTYFPNGIAPDGSRLFGSSLGGFAGAPNSQTGNSCGTSTPYVFTRTSSRWATTALGDPPARFDGCYYTSSTDLSRELWAQGPAFEDLYLHRSDGSYAEIGHEYPPGTAKPQVFEQAESADLSHVVFELSGSYWPGDTTSSPGSSLNEYVGTGNATPLLVGVSGGPGSGALISSCGTSLGSTADVANASHALSTDGSVVFFTSSACGSSPPADELFARLGESQTVAISEPTIGPGGDCAACGSSSPENATYQTASTDGRRAFFTTTQPLLGTDTTNNLYEYDFDAPAGQKIVRLSTGDTSGGGAQVQGVVGTSDDGSHIYFVADGVLTTEPNGVGSSAASGEPNLYLYQRDAQHPGGQTSFVATLSSSDLNGSLLLTRRGTAADVTPDGAHIVFTSSADLTPDDTSTARQIFEYDASSHSLVRVSVGQGGFNDNGNTTLDDASILVGHAKVVSDDGAYVFFQSSAGLTPEALDHVVIDVGFFGEAIYANNVYEYHDGKVSLISDGRDRTDGIDGISLVSLLGTDSSGHDVFFTTADQLVPQDTDTQMDTYDARIGGGFPAPLSQPCAGDACQGRALAPPATQLPGSAAFNGLGNPVPKHGKAKRRHHHKKRHHVRSASNNRGGAQ